MAQIIANALIRALIVGIDAGVGQDSIPQLDMVGSELLGISPVPDVCILNFVGTSPDSLTQHGYTLVICDESDLDIKNLNPPQGDYRVGGTVSVSDDRIRDFTFHIGQTSDSYLGPYLAPVSLESDVYSTRTCGGGSCSDSNLIDLFHVEHGQVDGEDRGFKTTDCDGNEVQLIAVSSTPFDYTSAKSGKGTVSHVAVPRKGKKPGCPSAKRSLRYGSREE